MTTKGLEQIAETAAALKAKLQAGQHLTQGRALDDNPANTGPCRPDCPVCQGLGWIRQDLPRNHPDFGRLQLCPQVIPWTVTGPEKYGLVRSEVESLTWDSVLPIGHAQEAARVVRAVIEQGAGWVYLYGNHGQAKSLILRVAVAEALRAGKFAAYANMADVIGHIQRAFDYDNPNRESEDRLDWWGSLGLLALDEFDRFNQTRWATASQFRLMDSRNVAAIRGESVTLIASNQAPDQLDSYYQSRIQDGRFITIPLYSQDARPFMSQADRF